MNHISSSVIQSRVRHPELHTELGSESQVECYALPGTIEATSKSNVYLPLDKALEKI